MTDTRKVKSGSPLKFLLKSRSRMYAIGAILALIVGISAMGIAQLSSPPVLESLMPADTQAYASFSADWAWQATGSIRNVPEVSKALTQAEKETGFSLSEDIVPWIGKIGVSVANVDKKDPRIIVAVQIKDAESFAKMVEKIKSKASQGGLTFTPDIYASTPIFRVTSQKAPKDMPAAISIINGWALIGIGKNGIETALDTYAGRTPSIMKNAVYAQSLQNLAPDSVFAMSFNPAVFMDLATKAAPKNTDINTKYMLEASNQQITFAIRDIGNGFKSDLISSPQSPVTRNMYKSLAATMKPVTNAVPQRVPDAVLTGIISNPNGLWKYYKTQLLTMMPTAKEKNEFRRGLANIAPLEKSLASYNNDAAFAVTWRKDRGFGLVLLAQADSHVAAVNTGVTIAAMLKQMGMPVQRGGSAWTLALPGMAMAVPPDVPLKLAPCMTAKDDWFVISTHPSWTAAKSATPNFVIPEQAAGANQIGFMSFQWLPSVLSIIEKQPGVSDDTDAKQGFALIRGLGLEDAKCTSWSTFAPDGSYAQQTAVISDWNWRAALDNTVNAIKNWKPSPKKPAKKGASTIDISSNIVHNIKG